MFCGPRPAVDPAQYLTDADRSRLRKRHSGPSVAEVLQEAARELEAQLAYAGKGGRPSRKSSTGGVMPMMARKTASGAKAKPMTLSQRLVMRCPVGKENAQPVAVLAKKVGTESKNASTILIKAKSRGEVATVVRPRTETDQKYGRVNILCYYRRS